MKSRPFDSQSGFKVLRNTQACRQLFQKKFATRWFFDVEIIIRNRKAQKLVIWEEPVTSWSDIKGSKLGLSQPGIILADVARVIFIRISGRI